MKHVTLRRATGTGVTLLDILELAPGAVGYFFAPQSFAIVRVRATEPPTEPPERVGSLSDSQPIPIVRGKATAPLLEWAGFAIEIDQVYEARLATEAFELRWLRDPTCAAGTGSAALTSETDLPLLPLGWKQEPNLVDVTCHDTPLLLTAQPAREQTAEARWLTVDAPRHGKLALPCEGAPATGQRLAWRWREYLGPAEGHAGEDGNQTVVAARLAGWISIGEETT